MTREKNKKSYSRREIALIAATSVKKKANVVSDPGHGTCRFSILKLRHRTEAFGFCRYVFFTKGQRDRLTRILGFDKECLRVVFSVRERERAAYREEASEGHSRGGSAFSDVQEDGPVGNDAIAKGLGRPRLRALNGDVVRRHGDASI